MATISIVLLLVVLISCQCSTRDVYIQPSEGGHCPGAPCYNISTFGGMAKKFSNSSGLVVHFLEGTHLLDLQVLVVFANLTNAVFEGNGRMEQGFHETVWQSTVVIKCTKHSSTGIAFVNSSNITFRYITITNCGADMNAFASKQFMSGPKREKHFCNASLGCFSVSGFTFDKVSVQNGSGSGLLAVMKESNLTITDSSFSHNEQVSSDCSVGGNIIIYHIDPSDCVIHKPVYEVLIASTNVSFGRIDNNTEGGGLAIIMLSKTYSVDIVLDHAIAYMNKGSRSVWIVSESVDTLSYNLTISNSVISYGHGLAVGTFQDSRNVVFEHECSRSVSADSFISLVNNKIINNTYKQSANLFELVFEGLRQLPSIRIESTDISHNQVFFSVFHVRSFAYQRPQFHVSLVNVTISNNSLTDPSSVYRPSALRASYVSTLTLNNVSITNNNMTGMWVVETAVVFKRNTTTIFHNNTAADIGGGMIMFDDSYLVFEDHSIVNFTQNRADKGGAIFAESSELSQSACFYQISGSVHPNSSKVYFSENQASIAGTAIYSDTIDCELFNTHQKVSETLFGEIFNYSAQTGSSVVSSDPTDVCFCDENDTINCSEKQLTMAAYPGEEISVSVVTVGIKNGVVPGVLQIQPLLDDCKVVNIKELHVYSTIAKNCTKIAFKVLTKCYALKVLNMNKYVLLNVSLSPCPLGFEISSKTNACDCEETLKRSVANISCDAVTGTISRKRGIWIGNISDCVIRSKCPFDYCITSQINFSLTDPDPQCAHNRAGILCGRCRDEHSLALGSNTCIHCPHFSYLAQIIPFAAAGFGLVALLMVLNLTVSIGTINGLIFYASIVKISESTGIFFRTGRIPVLSQFIAWLNLDLGIETCFYHGMTAYHKVWLQFVFPLYIWFIIATIIVLCRYSTWLSNKIGGNVVQVLATLILLSFTKIFRTFAPALTWTRLVCEGNSTTSTVRWYMDGNVPYFSPEHYVLMAAAVLFLLLVVPYTLALLFDALIEKYVTRIRFFRRQWIKFKPFVDAYHGPYKDNCRFWTGLLLLVRMLFTLVSLHLDTFGTLIFITASTTVLLSLLVAFEGIYQKKYLNILECSILLNLGLLSALAAVYQNKDDDEQTVTIISVSVALVTFIGVLVYHLFLHLKFFKKLAVTKCFNCEESERLLNKRNQLVQPTSTDVWLKRESLIFS